MLSFSALSELPIASAVSTLSANAFMSGVDVTSSAGVLGYDAEASTIMASASATTSAGTLGVAAQTTLASATATLYVGTLNAAVDENLVSVSATTTIGTLTAKGKASIIPSASTGTFTAGILEYDAKANITLDTVTADADLTVNVSNLEDEDAQGTITISGVSATTSANWDTVNGVYAVQVIYLATDFERTRTVNIVPYGNYTVYVTR